MSPDQLTGLRCEQSVTVHCRTTAKHIYYPDQNDGTSRQRTLASEAQLSVIPYTITGQVVGIRQGAVDYLVLQIMGEAAVIDHYRIRGVKRRLKECHIPLTAIHRVTEPIIE